MLHASAIIKAMIKVCSANIPAEEIPTPFGKGELWRQIDNPGPF